MLGKFRIDLRLTEKECETMASIHYELYQEFTHRKSKMKVKRLEKARASVNE